MIFMNQIQYGSACFGSKVWFRTDCSIIFHESKMNMDTGACAVKIPDNIAR